jgi:hypothetical protein
VNCCARLSRDSLAAQILLGGRASQGKPEGCHLRRTVVEKISMTLTTRPKALKRKSRSAYPVSADFVRVQAPHDCFHVGVTQPLRSGAKVNSGPKAFRGERRSEFVELGKLFAACDAEERLWCEFSTGGCRPKLDFLDLSQGRSRTGEARRAWLLALRHNGRAAVDRVQFPLPGVGVGPRRPPHPCPRTAGRASAPRAIPGSRPHRCGARALRSPATTSGRMRPLAARTTGQWRILLLVWTRLGDAALTVHG